MESNTKDCCNDKQPTVKVILVGQKIKLLINGEEVDLDGVSLFANSKTTQNSDAGPCENISDKDKQCDISNDSILQNGTENIPKEFEKDANILTESSVESLPLAEDKHLKENTNSDTEQKRLITEESYKNFCKDIINNNTIYKTEVTDKIEIRNEETCDKSCHKGFTVSAEVKKCNISEIVDKDTDHPCDNQEQKKNKNKKKKSAEKIPKDGKVVKPPGQPRTIKTPKYLENLFCKLTVERKAIAKGENMAKQNCDRVTNNRKTRETIQQNQKISDVSKNDLNTLDDLKPITFTSSDDHNSIAAKLCESLQEENQDWIKNLLIYLGTEKVMELFEKTREKERNGGILVKDGSRRKTPGGVFISLLQEDKSVTNEVYKKIFEETLIKTKRLRCIERKRKLLKQNEVLKEQLLKEGFL
ncbi:uncharacterized protein LOC106670211 [Cimex lectularius]|uniref:Phosphorylated adapter RNA export protein n=1 Tax=Cimex lectularius TaxID=79782 RepID=A0A8I6SL21_CIMLE|nr:uncharacterized protein LOC106670211 [Cimex lectularius]XP_024085181.1 uncharacterized protein LOC106670211 [Cimex lectularius]